MPSEQGTELNLSELVGNLLAETEGIPSLEETHSTDDHDNLKHDGSDNKDSNNNDDGDHKNNNSSNNYHNNDIENDDILPDLLPMSQLPHVENTSDHDLASMVSQAIHNMNDNADSIHTHGDGEGEADADLHSKEQEWANILRQGILQADQEMQEHQQAQHEQHNTSVYQESAPQPTDDQVLDQDDENLRLAILDSLQHLEQEKKTKKHSKKDKKSKEKKKSSKKTEKEKDKSKEKEKSKKKEKKSKDKKSAAANDSDILNFEDVIKGFMEQTESVQPPPAATQVENNAPMGDAETQALVEATLKAFENQLLGNSTSTKTKATAKKAPKNSSHKFAKSLPPPLPMPFFPITQKRKVKPKSAKKASKEKHEKEPKTEDTSSKKKKTSKKKTNAKDDYNEDEFSKALAEMVNQVVNTSLVDNTQVSLTETADVSKSGKTSKKKSKQKSKDKKTESSSDKAKSKEIKASSKKTSSPKKKQDIKVIPLDPELFKESVPHAAISDESSKDTTDVSNLNNDDALDLHQIMQNAMSMAFQEQVQNPLPPSVMERFDKELTENQFLEPLSRKSLTDRSVIRSRYVPPKKKKKEKKKGELKFNNIHGGLASTKFNLSKKNAIGSKIVVFKPQKIKQELENNAPKTEKDRLRKKFSRICKECAKKGKKWSIERRKKLKDEEKTERNRLKLQRKELKEEQKAKRELEKKELEEIVAKGPPYPEDLCLTSSGRPRKPYRRYTPEEMIQRAAMSTEELIAFDRSHDESSKENREQLKNNSLTKLKQLTLFNPNLAQYGQRLNDLKSSIKKVRKSSSGTLSIQKKSKKRHVSVFDPKAKTVVHREKIPFHPPWQIPVNPPFALPVARRKKHHSLEKMSRRKRALYQRTLISNTLLPILHTLRAAAKATASAGVDPERSREHLRSMLYQARLTIADTLQKARSANQPTDKREEIKEKNEKLAEKPNIPIPIMRATLKVKKEEPAAAIFGSNSEVTEETTKETDSDDVQIISATDEASTAKTRKADESDAIKIGSKRTFNDATDDSDIRQNVTEVINKLSTLIPSLSKANSLPLMAPPKKKPKSMLNMDEVKIPLKKPQSSSSPNSTFITDSNVPRRIPIVKMEENTNNDSSLLSEGSDGMALSTPNSDQTKNEDIKVRFKSPAMQVPKKTADLFNKYSFSLPTTNSVGKTVKSIQVMKRVKDYLPAEDITRLKKVKETYRKRKWRLANSDKNKDLELRTRIKMAARKQFGDSDSDEKQQWIAKEYEIRKVKLELDPTTKSNSAVMVTDEEILNIIAVSLDKLDVARTIEHDIQEEVKNHDALQKKKSLKKPNAKIQMPTNNPLKLPIVPIAQKNTDASSDEVDKPATSPSLVAAEHLAEHVAEQVLENRIDPSLASKRPRDDEESETSLNKDALPSQKKTCLNI